MGWPAAFLITFMAVMASARDISVTLSVDGKPVLALQVPPEAKVTSSNAYINIRTTNMSLHIWAVPDAKTAEDAMPRAGEFIKSEFINFKTTATNDIVIAGAPAKHVIGAGNEADDGDPGHAEVVLFVVGSHLFAGCVHGEFDDASRARAPMLAVLQTAQDPSGSQTPLAGNVSIRHEVRHAIEKSSAWLGTQQNADGHWSSPEHPALTALVLTALVGPPPGKADSPAIEKGYDYLLRCVQPDGGIYIKDVQSYNTSVALNALALRNRPQDRVVIEGARLYLIRLQVGDDQLGANSPFVGGIGYGASEKRPDLSNTALALEALYNSKPAPQDSARYRTQDLNWKAAIRFVQNCQNLPAFNSQPWASDDPQNKGGFIYAPGRSNGGQTNLASGRVAYRSYGSMTYAGLLSYIYADLKPDDPRVTSALDWLRGNYSVDENPALGQQGLYYYYQMMAKALTFAGVDILETKDGRKINWREDLALKLINLQHADGSWANENGRWWEKDPVLDTAYSVTALEIIENKL
jgi:squalene-hopene/tetraprenyl-beta-curcumene cyclase